MCYVSIYMCVPDYISLEQYSLQGKLYIDCNIVHVGSKKFSQLGAKGYLLLLRIICFSRFEACLQISVCVFIDGFIATNFDTENKHYIHYFFQITKHL